MKLSNLIWAGIGLAIAATALMLIRSRRYSEEKPPRLAPQLDIRNPGEQSEFLTTPQETEYER
ncbi:MAG TPA: hypothetical protein VNS32_25375 [Flavisolibacter sp.]|nr:hypothetical protein [Flavisolibacter sp.]